MSGVAPIKLGLIGAAGRMGAAVLDQLTALDDMRLVAVADRADLSPHSALAAFATDVAGVFDRADVVIDFSAPGSTADHAGVAATTGTAYVVGTTGLTDQDHAALDTAGTTAAVVQAGNFATGVAVLMAAVELVSSKLGGDDWDIEILDRHHRHKVDSPSGTALMLGEAAARGRGVDFAGVRAGPYDGLHGAREPGGIAISAQRGGAVIGEHEVSFMGGHERLTLTHKAEDRGLFAAGALRAARFAATAAPGRYGLRDVLGL